jgi:hypothetical protein
MIQRLNRKDTVFVSVHTLGVSIVKVGGFFVARAGV